MDEEWKNLDTDMPHMNSEEEWETMYPTVTWESMTTGDTAIDELLNAFSRVLSCDGSIRYNSLAYAASDMNKISDIIRKANSGLAGAWDTAARNCSDLEQSVANLMSEISTAVYKYYNDTHASEVQLKNTVDSFNSDMDNIMRELESLGP